MVSPDFGGTVRARRFAKKLNNARVAIAEKRRIAANKSEFVGFVGGESIEETVVMYDDMIDTGSTIREVEEPLRKRGAREILVCTTHGIFSRDAAKKFRESGLQIIATNSIPRTAEWSRANPWLTVVPCDGLLAKAIHEASTVGGSVSKLVR